MQKQSYYLVINTLQFITHFLWWSEEDGHAIISMYAIPLFMTHLLLLPWVN